MKEIAALIVCCVVVGIYTFVLNSLGLLNAMWGPDAGFLVRTISMIPLLLLIGACWSAITGRPFPKTLDPFGIVTSEASSSDATEGNEAKKIKA